MSLQINPSVEADRQAYLDRLYFMSGRTNGLYSGLYQQRIRELVEHDMRSCSRKRPTRLEDLDLPFVVYGALRRAGYSLISEIAALSDDQLLAIKNIGPTNLRTLRQALEKINE